MWGFEVAVMVSMIALNSVFAAYEIALATISLSRLSTLAEGGSRGARAALHMKQNMEGSLAVIQLCITLVGVIASATGGAGAEESIAPWLQSGLNLSPTAARTHSPRAASSTTAMRGSLSRAMCATSRSW